MIRPPGMTRLNPRTLAVSLLCVFAAGCMNDPSPTGIGLLPPSDFPFVRRDTLFATTHATSRFLVNTIAVDRMLVGTYGNYQSWSLLRFSGFPDSVVGPLSGVTVLDAKLKIRGAYHFGDSLGALAFTAYRATGYWRGDSLTYDSLTLRSNDYYSPIPVSPTFVAPTGDSTASVVQIDTAMVSQWLTTNTDSGFVNQGILLKPSPSQRIQGFSSFYAADANARPKLIVTIRKNGVVGTFSDSIGVAKFVSYIGDASLKTDPNLLYIQNGVAYRGFLNFDLSKIPRPSSVLRADLELTLNPAASKFNSYKRDSLYVYYVNGDGSTNTASYAICQAYDTGGHHVYRFSIVSYVQLWLRTLVVNGVVIGGFTEMSTFDLFALYGSTGSADVRPRLVVTYSPARPQKSQNGR